MNTRFRVYEALAFILGILVGVPVAVYGTEYLADNVTTLATVTLVALIVIAIVAITLILSRRKLLSWLFDQAEISLEELAKPARGCLEEAINLQKERAIEHAETLLRIVLARIAWFASLRWIIGTAMALLIVFAGLLGSALLFKQNKLLTEQNRFFKQQNMYFKEQNEYFKTQNQAIANQFETAERTRLIRALYEVTQPTFADRMLGIEAEPASTARSRSDALLAFVTIERQNNVQVVQLPKAQLQRTLFLGEDLDLTRVNLRGADFTNADLIDADFTDATLTDANLVDAFLFGADFTRADLLNADLTGADLTDAILIDADLSGADLTDATLTGADLTRADLTDATLTGADLTRADLSVATLTGADLTGADLPLTDLTDATLTGADLTRADLTDATLTGADLTRARLTNATLTDADLNLAYVDDPDWLAHTKKIAAWFDDSRWIIKDNGPDSEERRRYQVKWNFSKP